MGLHGDVLDLHARHGAIMAPEAPDRKNLDSDCGSAHVLACQSHPVTDEVTLTYDE